MLFFLLRKKKSRSQVQESRSSQDECIKIAGSINETRLIIFLKKLVEINVSTAHVHSCTRAPNLELKLKIW